VVIGGLGGPHDRVNFIKNILRSIKNPSGVGAPRSPPDRGRGPAGFGRIFKPLQESRFSAVERKSVKYPEKIQLHRFHKIVKNDQKSSMISMISMISELK
jgi:hypothetical protein